MLEAHRTGYFLSPNVKGGYWVCCLSVIMCACVCLSGTNLLRNCWTDLADILHRDGGLSRALFSILAAIAPGVPPGELKMYRRGDILSVLQ